MVNITKTIFINTILPTISMTFVFARAFFGCDGACDCSVNSQNRPPVIEKILADSPSITPGMMVFLTAVAVDEDGDKINYNWSSSGGTILTGGASDIPNYSPTTNPARWQAPDTSGDYTITCIVSDGKDTNSKSITVTVK